MCLFTHCSRVASVHDPVETWQGPCVFKASNGNDGCIIEDTIVLGGLFPLHSTHPDPSPGRLCSDDILPLNMERMEAMRFAIDEINARDDILPDIRLTYEMRDTCKTPAYANLQTVRFVQRENTASCDTGSLPISGVVGAASSGPSIAAANLLSIFKIPQISYASTSATLSEPRYKYFLRTVPPDIFQAKALASISSALGLRYPSVLSTEGAYGRDGATEVIREYRATQGVCIAANVDIGPNAALAKNDSIYTDALEDLTDYVSRNSSAAVAFSGRQGTNGFTTAIANETHLLPAKFTWLATDSWATNPKFLLPERIQATRGTIGVAPTTKVVHRFLEHFLSLHPTNNTGPQRNPWFSELWTSIFSCDPDLCGTSGVQSESCRRCLAHNLRNTAVYNHTQNTKIAFVFDAVYAFAKALDAMQRSLCGGQKGFCNAMKASEASRRGAADGAKLLSSLKSLSFPSESGSTVSFDGAGDPLIAVYDIFNFQQRQGASMGHLVRVGAWQLLSSNSTTPRRNTLTEGVVDLVTCSDPALNASNCTRSQLKLDTNRVQWRDRTFGYEERPTSVCSASCKTGEMAIEIPGFPSSVSPSCCWKCQPCKATDYTPRQTLACRPCPKQQKVNLAQNGCDDLEMEVFSMRAKSAQACVGVAAVLLLPIMLAFLVIISVMDILHLQSTLTFSSMILTNLGSLGVLLLVFLYLIPPSAVACTLRAVWSTLSLTSLLSPFIVETLDILITYRRDEKSEGHNERSPEISAPELPSIERRRPSLQGIVKEKPFAFWAFVFVYTIVAVILVLAVAVDTPRVSDHMIPNVQWLRVCAISTVYWSGFCMVVVQIIASMAIRFYCLFAGLYVTFTIRLFTFMLLATVLLVASMLVAYAQISHHIVREAILILLHLAAGGAIYSVVVQDLLRTLVPERRGKRKGTGQYSGGNRPDGLPSVSQQVRTTLTERSLFNAETRRNRSVDHGRRRSSSAERTTYGTGGSEFTLEKVSSGLLEAQGYSPNSSWYIVRSSHTSLESGYVGRSSEVGLAEIGIASNAADNVNRRESSSAGHQPTDNIPQIVVSPAYLSGNPTTPCRTAAGISPAGSSMCISAQTTTSAKSMGSTNSLSQSDDTTV